MKRTPGRIGRGSSGVDDTGIEPVTSSVSGKRSPAELIVRAGTVTTGDGVLRARYWD
jgi:hypothetical protein